MNAEFLNAAFRTAALQLCAAATDGEVSLKRVGAMVFAMYGVQGTNADVKAALRGDDRFDCTNTTVYLLEG